MDQLDPMQMTYEEFQRYIRERSAQMPQTPGATTSTLPSLPSKPPALSDMGQPMEPVDLGPQDYTDIAATRALQGLGQDYRPPMNANPLAERQIRPQIPQFQARAQSEGLMPAPQPVPTANMEPAPKPEMLPPGPVETGMPDLPPQPYDESRVRTLRALQSIAEGLGNFRAKSGAQIMTGTPEEPPFVASSIREDIADEQNKLRPDEAQFLSKSLGQEVPAGVRADLLTKMLPVIGRNQAQNAALSQRVTTRNQQQQAKVSALVSRVLTAPDIREARGATQASDMVKRALALNTQEGDKAAAGAVIRYFEGARPSDNDRNFWIKPFGALDQLSYYASKAFTGRLPEKVRTELGQVADETAQSKGAYLKETLRTFAHANADLLNESEDQLYQRLQGATQEGGSGASAGPTPSGVMVPIVGPHGERRRIPEGGLSQEWRDKGWSYGR